VFILCGLFSEIFVVKFPFFTLVWPAALPHHMLYANSIQATWKLKKHDLNRSGGGFGGAGPWFCGAAATTPQNRYKYVGSSLGRPKP
jgi:hypothetical protein